jgi:hypothetical protein
MTGLSRFLLHTIAGRILLILLFLVLSLLAATIAGWVPGLG